jgi:hypothetical protein
VPPPTARAARTSNDTKRAVAIAAIYGRRRPPHLVEGSFVSLAVSRCAPCPLSTAAAEAARNRCVRFWEAGMIKPMTEMVKVFGCRQAYENCPSTNRGPQARVYGDLVFGLAVVTVAPALRWVGDGLARGDSSPGEL